MTNLAFDCYACLALDQRGEGALYLVDGQALCEHHARTWVGYATSSMRSFLRGVGEVRAAQAQLDRETAALEARSRHG